MCASLAYVPFRGMPLLEDIILAEIAACLAVFFVLLMLLVWWLLRKIVVVPTLTVATDKDAYFRDEPVGISGSLKSDGDPIPNQSVGLAIKPPVGDIFSVPGVSTDADGNFTGSWDVPVDAETGAYELTASALGVSATKTFTLETYVVEPPQ